MVMEEAEMAAVKIRVQGEVMAGAVMVAQVVVKVVAATAVVRAAEGRAAARAAGARAVLQVHISTWHARAEPIRILLSWQAALLACAGGEPYWRCAHTQHNEPRGACALSVRFGVTQCGV